MNNHNHAKTKLLNESISKLQHDRFLVYLPQLVMISQILFIQFIQLTSSNSLFIYFSSHSLLNSENSNKITRWCFLPCVPLLLNGEQSTKMKWCVNLHSYVAQRSVLSRTVSPCQFFSDRTILLIKQHTIPLNCLPRRCKLLFNRSFIVLLVLSETKIMPSSCMDIAE